MTLVLDADDVVNIVGALLVVVLGAFVATIRPRRRGNVLFAVYCVTFGLAISATNIGDPERDGVTAAAWLLVALFSVPAGISLALLAFAVPEPLSRRDRALAIIPICVAAAYGVASLAVNGAARERLGSAFSASADSLDALVFGAGVLQLVIAVWIGYLFLLALRFGRLPAEATHRQDQYLFLTAGLVLFPAAYGGLWLVFEDPLMRQYGLITVPVFACLAIIWLLHAVRGRRARASRNLALLCLATPLSGMIWGSLGWPGGFGVARTLSVAVFAYAMLRHQLLDIDVRIKWTLKQSTVAAIFIAVFFVVSEMAQELFSERVGPFVGIAAAGLLVFAIHPLQRVAERLSDKAMPNVHDPRAGAPTDKADAYRAALRMALADRVLTRQEEEHLASMADALGISHEAALALRAEIERETETGGGE